MSTTALQPARLATSAARIQASMTGGVTRAMRIGRGVGIAVIALALSSAAWGQIVWENSADSMNSGANWVGNVAPGVNDVARFSSATPATSPRLTANLSIKGIEFTSTSGAWTFGGTNGGSAEILTIGSSGIVNDSSNVQTFDGNPSTDLTIHLGAHTSFISNGSGGITLTSGLSDFQNNGFNLTLGGTSTSSSNTIGEILSGTGGVIKTGTGTWTTTVNHDYTGATRISGGVLAISNLANGGGVSQIGASTNAAANLVLDGGTLRLTGGNDSTNRLFTLTENGGAIEATNGTVNFSNTGTMATSGDGNRTLTLGGTNTGNNYMRLVIADPTVGKTSLNKDGAGTWILYSANTYTGATNINAGTLRLQAADRLSDLTAVTVASGATFDLALYSETVGSLAGAGLVQLTGTTNRALTVGGDNTSTTFSGTLDDTNTGNLQLIKTGTGTLTLSGSNTNAGGFALNGGTLALGSSGALASSGTISFGGGTLQFGASNTTDYSSRFSTGTNQAYRIDTNGQTVAFGTALTSSGGSLTKLGAGTLTVGNANSYTGATTIAEGTLSTGDISVAGGVSGLGNAATAVVLGSASTAGTLSYSGNTDTFTRGLTINAGGGGFDVTTSGQTVTMNTGNIAAAGLFTAGGAGNITVDSTITGAGGLTKTGAGTLTLSGSNSYTGATTIAQGTLIANDLSVNSGVSRLGNATSAVVLGDGVNTGTLQYTGSSDTFTRGLTVNAGGGRLEVTSAGQTLAFSTAGIGTSGVMTFAGAGNTTLNSTSAITGSGALNKVDGGTLTISGANSHTGGTTVAGGTVTVTSTGSLAGNATALAVTGGTLNLNNAAQTVSAFSGSASTVNLGSGHAFIVNTAASNTYSGTLAGAGSLTKSGTGSLTLSGNNNGLTGGVTLTAGTLNLDANNAAGTGTFTINGGTLDNTSGSSRTLANSAHTWAGNFTFTGGSSLDLGTGTVTLTGNRTITVNNNTLTVGGAIVDGINSYGITKAGNGTLVFGGANTYDGGTTVNAGTLTVNSGSSLGSSAGGLTVNGGTLNLNQAAQTVSSLSGSGGTINFGTGHAFTVNNAATNTFAGTFGGSGSFTKTGAGLLTLSGNSLGYTGAVVVDQGTLRIQHSNALGSGTAGTTVQSGATLHLDGALATAQNGTLTLAGGSALKATGSNNRWANNITLTGDATVTNDNSTGYFALGVTTSRYNRALNDPSGTPTDPHTLNLNGNTLTLSGTTTASDNRAIYVNSRITGTGNIVIDMTNTADTVRYTPNLNTYTGSTTINNGTLSLATLYNTYPNDPAHPNHFAINGDMIIGDGTGTANSARLTIQANGEGGAVYDELMNFTTNVKIYRDGEFSLRAAQSIAGLEFTGGNIELGTTGGLYLNGDVIVNASAGNTATINGSGNSTLSLTIHQGPEPVANASRIFNVVGGVGNASDLTIGATINNGSIVKNGAGIMTITGDNSNDYEGTTTINNGIIAITNGGALGQGDLEDSKATIVNSGGMLRLSGGITVADEVLKLNGTGFGANGALQNFSGNNTYSGPIELVTDSRIQSQADTLLLNGGLTSSTNASLDVRGTGHTTIRSDIGIGSGAITKFGSGTLTLSGANNFSGTTTVWEGVLQIESNSALGNTTVGTTVKSGAAIQFSNVTHGDLSTDAEELAINGTGIGGAGALRNIAGSNTFGGAVTLETSSLITANSGTQLTIAGGVIADANTATFGTTAQNGNLTVSGNYTANNTLAALTKNGSGSLTLSGASSTVGTINMNAGTMTISSSGNTHANVVNVNGGTLNLNGANTTTSTVNVNGGALAFGGAAASTGQVHLNSGTVSVGGSSTVNTEEFAANAGTTLTIATGGTVVADYSSGTTTFSGAMAGGGTFEKAGAGTLVFNNTFAATDLTLEISGGTLKLTGGAHIEFDTIKITGNTVLDFSNSANTWLSSDHLDIAEGVTVTVINWIAVANNSAASTIWYANQTVNSGSLGATDKKNEQPFTQITFVDLQGPSFPTTWVAEPDEFGYFDHEIRPTPEPATYGAMFLSACFGLLAWRRYRRGRVAPATTVARA